MKKFRIIIVSILCLIVLGIYPVYTCIILNISASPNSFNELPTDGTYMCQTENFDITITFAQNFQEEDISPISAKITINSIDYELQTDVHGGHGTPLAPVQPCTILEFNYSQDDTCFNFLTSKYKAEENSFTLLSIYVNNKTTFNEIKKQKIFHFTQV